MPRLQLMLLLLLLPVLTASQLWPPAEPAGPGEQQASSLLVAFLADWAALHLHNYQGAVGPPGVALCREDTVLTPRQSNER